jgi:hypothetical protein
LKAAAEGWQTFRESMPLARSAEPLPRASIEFCPSSLVSPSAHQRSRWDCTFPALPRIDRLSAPSSEPPRAGRMGNESDRTVETASELPSLSEHGRKTGQGAFLIRSSSCYTSRSTNKASNQSTWYNTIIDTARTGRRQGPEEGQTVSLSSSARATSSTREDTGPS